MSEYADFRDRLAAAIDTRFYNIEYLDWFLTEGRGLFWSDGKAALVCELKTFPSGALAIEGIVAAGKLKNIKRLRDQAEIYAKTIGCQFALVGSREGWERAFKNDGYEKHQTMLVKEL